SSTSAA
nr:Chain X, fibril forming peptide from Bovine Pancreatic Ribonuclease (RNase A) [synthetic construct]